MLLPVEKIDTATKNAVISTAKFAYGIPAYLY
jgi:hypothetical protein